MTLISGLDAHEESQADHKINIHRTIYQGLLFPVNSCACKYQYIIQIDTYAIYIV